MAEKYYSISPYSYCGGDPVNFVDPDGRIIADAEGTSEAFKKQFISTANYMMSKGTYGPLLALTLSSTNA